MPYAVRELCPVAGSAGARVKGRLGGGLAVAGSQVSRVSIHRRPIWPIHSGSLFIQTLRGVGQTSVFFF